MDRATIRERHNHATQRAIAVQHELAELATDQGIQPERLHRQLETLAYAHGRAYGYYILDRDDITTDQWPTFLLRTIRSQWPRHGTPHADRFLDGLFDVVDALIGP